MFEAGKFYKQSKYSEVWECVSIVENGKYGWMKTDLSMSNRIYTPYQTFMFDSIWSEFKPPVVQKKSYEISVYNGVIHLTNNGFTNHHDILGKIEVIVSDGKLKDVRII